MLKIIKKFSFDNIVKNKKKHLIFLIIFYIEI